MRLLESQRLYKSAGVGGHPAGVFSPGRIFVPLKFELPMLWTTAPALNLKISVGLEAARNKDRHGTGRLGCACRLDGYWPLGQLDRRRVASDIRAMSRALLNVAIIDDDPAVLKALARLLRTRAIAAVTFQSGRQFLASLPEPLPDCLILDFRMPGMTGLEVQQALAGRGIRIPTIIITAHDEAGIRERCKSAGAVACLAKPVPQEALFAAIAAAGSDAAR